MKLIDLEDYNKLDFRLDRIENSFDTKIDRLQIAIDKLENKLDSRINRVERTIWIAIGASLVQIITVLTK